MKIPDIVLQGNNNGERMVVRYRTAKGTDVLGLALPNIYDVGAWDLGPTWCYLIPGEKTTLIDTGRLGNFEIFHDLLTAAGKSFSDIDRIIVTHCHEDHDGNLAPIMAASGAELWAHPVYHRMISYYPDIVDGARHPEMPGSCRSCEMPESFYRNCLPYHRERNALRVDYTVGDDTTADGNLRFAFTPGHTADSICIILEDEIIFTGDTILPDITPHPSLTRTFTVDRRILPEEYRRENTLYGLRNYLASLLKLTHLPGQPFPATLPAHRLFYGGQFNIIHSSIDRAHEIVRFHIDRCRDMLDIVARQPAKVKEIARQYFEASQLAGSGRHMAYEEVQAHLEILQECGDIRWTGEKEEPAQATGTRNFVAGLEKFLS